ncbi:ATP-binding protein [Agreia sp. COWG]|uniref:ATP-binding protein n=1 Tax=Agreia sp. COWG TaxID=2773266 RepID=UPI001928C1E6|nr:ATP-binding protein [Agreia sp. COWG]
MNELSELTLEDLAASLRAEAGSGKKADTAAWDTLIQIADDLNSGDRVDLLTRNRRWLLRQVSVIGFRGAKHEVNLTIDNLQGVTVLFGENGSGKSSLAEAVRVALEGRTGATHLGSSGHVHELWGAHDQRSQGVEESTVKVVLVDEATTDSLSICATITESGVKRTGVLESGAEQFELNDTSAAWRAWADSVRASPPVLAYAELADELQKKSDLQIWLTSCLAMDNASRVFDSRVKAQVEAASNAEKAIIAAKQTATRAVGEVDEEALRQGLEGIDPLEWIELNSREELAGWLDARQLAERQKLGNHLDSGFLITVPAYGAAFLAAWDAWSTAATKALLTAQVTDSLVEMNSRVISSGQGDNEGICPTCGTSHTDWRRHLRDEAARLTEAQNAAAELKNLVRRSRTDLIIPLSTCLLVLPPEFDAGQKSGLKTLLDEAVAVLQSTDDLNINLLTAIHSLAKWSERPEALPLMEAALAASGLEHEWRCNRWDAVSPYLAAFDANIDLAGKTATLKKARGKWNSHLARIRGERSSSLQALVGPAVASLLGDVGISVSAIDITKSESRLELQNAKGESVELAHLSAGQRNALILGPVIATAESGIFAFSILDDPVHAFDDFRVDKLSSTLAEIGRNQSLVLTTHDARFVEYLRVHATLAFVVLATTRDEDGQMTLTPTLDPPAELIKFGRKLANELRKSQASEGRAEITALLRMALDEALETVALRHFARLTAVAAKTDREVFDQAMFTSERKQVLRGFLADSPPQLGLLTMAWQKVSTSARRWSDSVHDPSAVPDPDQLDSDFDTAEEAIELLRGIHW